MVGSGQWWILPQLNDIDHSSFLPHLGKVKGAESYIEDNVQER